MPKAKDQLTTIRTEGSLLPVDLLARVSEEDATLDGMTQASYHRSGERLNEAISRSWTALQSAWSHFQAGLEALPAGDRGTTITRERWLLPLFEKLDYGRLHTAQAHTIDGKSYPISHSWGLNVPIHLVSTQVDLDKTMRGVAGAATASPHSMLQVFLNRSDDHLWGFVSNGFKLRVLRDNLTLTRQAYVEFDLEAMMNGDAYSDFRVLWLICHQSRVEADRPSDCWLEKWMKEAEDRGTRALDHLRGGVEAAITALGVGFLEHPANGDLGDKLRDGRLDKQNYYRQLLRIVYRLLFMFVAEDRDLLLNREAAESARDTYRSYYSTQRLRGMAEKFVGTRHSDLFEALRLVMRLLGGQGDGSTLGITALGSFLFSDRAVADVISCKISNRPLLTAIRALSQTYDDKIKAWRNVDYRNLGPEELGSVYESLLELHPEINTAARTFALSSAGGNERKTTGSYYTPTSLINALLDSALDPVLDEAAKKGAEAILDLKVCDPACGSGHFLIAAANRMAKRLASIRSGELEPPPPAIQTAKREIIGRCIYGVDINPMAAELCKVSLWMEALDPGKPLSFLDHHIQVGNSLLGTTPKLMQEGIPNDAFEPIEGDDKKQASALRKQNKNERKQRDAGLRQLGLEQAPAADYGYLSDSMQMLASAPDESLDDVRQKEAFYAELARDDEYIKARLLADAWCSAFVWQKRPHPKSLPDGSVSTRPQNEGGASTPASSPSLLMGEGAGGWELPLTDLLYRHLERDPQAENLQTVRKKVVELTDRYGFFHWHVAFSDVFQVPDDLELAENEAAGWNGGFDVVLGNPPWERIKIQEKEWFAQRDPAIAGARNAAERRRMIAALADTEPILLQAFAADKREAEGKSHFTRKSGRFPLCGRGDVNTYTVFAETARNLLNCGGRVGIILPTGIVTDDTTKFFLQDLMKTSSIVSLYDFENRKRVFPAVEGNIKFCLLTMTNVPHTDITFGAQLDEVSLLQDRRRQYTLSVEDIRAINPNTMNCPMFVSDHDASIVKYIHHTIPIAFREYDKCSPWGVSLYTLFHMTNDSDCFCSLEQLRDNGWQLRGNTFVRGGDSYIPLYEAKLVHQFNHRSATFEGIDEADRFKIHARTNSSSFSELHDPNYAVLPRHWIPAETVEKKYISPAHTLIGFRNAISAVADSRSLVATIFPKVGVGNSLPLVHLDSDWARQSAFVANLNCITLDYVLRQKASGGNLNFYILKQLPVIPPHTYAQPLLDFITPRVLELSYTAWDLQPFARDLDYQGAPFVWDEARRFLLRCELDALYFHLYGIERDDVAYILETFPIVKKKDVKDHCEYRTKRVILEMYDLMADLPTMQVPAPKPEHGEMAVPDVSQWVTPLDPPPADPRAAHEVE